MHDTAPVRLLPALLGAVLVAASLYFARSVLAAVVFALFAIALVWPIQSSLQARIPKFAALALTVLLSLFVLGLLLLTITWGFSQIGRWVVGNVNRFQEVYSSTAAWLEGHGIFVTGLLVERFDVIWVIGLVRAIAARLNSMVGFALLVFAFATLGILEVAQVEKRMKKLEIEHSSWQLSDTVSRIARQFRKYMAIRTLASVLTGLATFFFAALVGLDLPVAWGIISFVLNYIPFLGPLAAVVLAALFAAAQFESWQMVLVILAGLGLIQFSIGNYVEPLIAGTALAVSPFMVLFSVFFWSLLWGIPGAFIGVPMTMALLVLCELSPSTRWIATLLSHSAGESRS